MSGCGGGHAVDRRVYCGFPDGQIAGHCHQMNGQTLHWGVTHHQRVRSYWISKPQKPALWSQNRPSLGSDIKARSSSSKSEVYLVLVKCKGPGIVGSMRNPLGRKSRLTLEDFEHHCFVFIGLFSDSILLTSPIHLSTDVVTPGTIITSVKGCVPAALPVDEYFFSAW